MLDLAKTLRSYTLKSRDGTIGSVKDFYFDDQFWTIRYLVADTAGWLAGRSVLLSPYAVEAVHRDAREIATTLTREQIEDSPLWHLLLEALGGPASEYGTFCHVARAPGRGGRRRNVLMLLLATRQSSTLLRSDGDGVYGDNKRIGTAHVRWTGFMPGPGNVFDCSRLYQVTCS
jgi:hypothetical protein